MRSRLFNLISSLCNYKSQKKGNHKWTIVAIFIMRLHNNAHFIIKEGYPAEKYYI